MTGTDIVALKARMADKAKQAVAELPPTSNGMTFSIKGGILSLGDEQMPGNQVCCVIIDSYRANSFYKNKWTPDVIESPTCYAFGRGGDDMAPHESMADHPDYFEPQHEQCQGCPKNEFGSADTGRGKACQNRIRLTLIPAGEYRPKKGSRDLDLDLIADPKDFSSTDAIFLSLPPTSVRAYSMYVSNLAAQHHLPPSAVITVIHVEPDAKNQVAVTFEMLEVLPDDLMVIADQRSDAAGALPFKGYTPPEDKAQSQQAGGLRGLRRKA